MKKWVFYLVLVAAIPVLGFGGFGGEDVGKLNPVQVMMVTQDKNGVGILTDSGHKGQGQNGAEAVECLKKTASSNIFLDTAEYLLLEPGTERWLFQFREYLRPSCGVCYVLGPVDLQEAANYLQLHQDNVNLAQYEAGETQLLTLIYHEGRMTLVRS